MENWEEGKPVRIHNEVCSADVIGRQSGFVVVGVLMRALGGEMSRVY